MAAQSPDFYNYSKLGEVRDPTRENPPFAWPGINVRNINGPFGNDSVKMSRGFMRSILTDPGIINGFSAANAKHQTQVIAENHINKGHYRLNFQFNPEYIERSVSQTIGAVNPILQSVSNLTQAIPGSASFNFTMTFNREMEVAAAANRKDSQTLWDGNDINPDDPRLLDPGLVGVWADIRMFDLIIGQGITQELLDLVSAFTEVQSYERYNSDTNASSGGTTDNTNTANTNNATDGTTFNENDFKKSYNANLGNSAFLNPLPVRIVFSDTFMVEGMVTGTAVAFQKFNHKMVPTICQINVNFQALYLGFAKKNAFLTDSLTQWAQDEAKDSVVMEEKTKELAKQLTSSALTLELWPNAILKDKNVSWSGQNAPNYNGNEDQFLIHSYSNASTSVTTNHYSSDTMWLGHYYNIVNTNLYKNKLDITLSARTLYSTTLPIVLQINYKPLPDATLNKLVNFDVKIELVYRYINVETGTKSNEISVDCVVSSISADWIRGGINLAYPESAYYYARRDYNVKLGKLPNIPKINSALNNTENLTDPDYKNLTMRVTITPTLTTEIDGNSITASQANAPVNFTSVFWDSRYDVGGARQVNSSMAVTKTPSGDPPPPKVRIVKS